MNVNVTGRQGIIAGVGIVFGLLMLVYVAAAEPDVMSPHSEQFREVANRPARALTGEWWQFILSIPSSENPLLDTTGEKCAVGQRGPVWFLAGTVGAAPVTRTCSIPDRKALFFPLINIVDVNVATQTAGELRAEIDPCIDAVTTVSLEVDGKPVKKLEEKPRRFRVKSKVFEVTLPANNLFGLAPGVYSPVVDDGFYVLLRPLSVGAHTLHIVGASDGCPITGGGPFGVDVTYHLTIVPVELDED